MCVGVVQAPDCQVAILPPVPSSLSVQTSRPLLSHRGCQTSMTVKWRARTRDVHAAVTRPSSDRGQRPAFRRRRRRHTSCQVQAPPTTCRTAVATSSTAARTTGQHQRRRRWSGLELTAAAGAATLYHATCSTSPASDDARVTSRTRTYWRTGSTVCCHRLHPDLYSAV